MTDHFRGGTITSGGNQARYYTYYLREGTSICHWRGGGEERERKKKGGEEERGGKEGEERLKPNSHVILYISTTCPLGSHEIHDSHMTTSEAT